ncbi:hypothetical protein N0V93_002084 [Gnomoniopsis smithogilvyi]|uniref:Uncharacterized protein n=1 Tax=Gnomoniopsis smithogilvyi TaxID=1191159 RepID=A0A9W9D1U3_9PEZI|nr:hypothetical protein N0V93_002084 [Gnomoniopsis smithogilvyi]
MASQSAASSSGGKVTLQSVLSDSAQRLATIQNGRLSLQQTLLRKVKDINQTVTDYWVSQAKSLPDSAEDAGLSMNAGKWLNEFAIQEATRAKAAAEKQQELWLQVEGMVKEAKDQDDKFWATWQQSLDQLGAANESAHHILSAQAAEASHQPHGKEHSTQATAKGSAPRRPTAFTATDTNSPSTKSSEPVSAWPSAIARLGPTKTAKKVDSDDTSYQPDVSTPSTPLPPAPSSLKARKIQKVVRHERKERVPRRIVAKSPAANNASPKTTRKPVKKRVLRQAARSPINPHPVTDPIPGQLYQAYYHSASAKERGWYMGTVLPWKSSDWAEQTMIDFSMRDMDLSSDWPDCCQPGYETKTMLVNGRLQEIRELRCIDRWSPGFEDDGPRVMDRKFLFLFFEDRPKRLGCLDIDPTQPLSLIQFKPTGGEPVPIDWVDARHLRMNTDDNKPVWGSCTAEKYRNKLDHVARIRQQARVSGSPMSSQRIESCPDTVPYPAAVASHQGSMRGDTEEQQWEAGVDSLTAVTEAPSSLLSETVSYAGPRGDKQQNPSITPLLSSSPAEVPSGQHPSHKKQGSFYPTNLNLSPIQTDIVETCEEPPTYIKRTTGKRSFSNDDEYDEGLGMDYDLMLKRSATQMSHPRTSIVGLPPSKLPRLDDYKVPGPSSSGSGFHTSSVSYTDANLSKPRSGSAASLPSSFSPTRGLMGPLS